MNQNSNNKKTTPNKKRRSPSKVRQRVTPVANQNEQAIVPQKTFHETFPVTLEYKEGKDLKKCFFTCKEHCDSYLKRYKLKKGSYRVFDTKPRTDEKKN